MRIGKSRESEVLHGMRGEAGMSDKEKGWSLNKYTTLEDAEKCVDNAIRLHNDALKTSMPTRASLMVLSIEELAKSFLVLFTTQEFRNIYHKDEFKIVDKILEELDGTDLMTVMDEFEISDFTTRVHGKKLDLVQSLIRNAQLLYSTEKKEFDPKLKKLASIYSTHLSTSINDPIKITEETFHNLMDIDSHKLNKIKQNGFYVDFKEGKAIEPKIEPPDLYFLYDLFNFMLSVIGNLINVSNGNKFLDYNPVLKDLFAKKADKPSYDFNRYTQTDKKVICSVCKYENPERAKFCMECGAKLE